MAKRVSNKKPVPPNRKVKIMVGSTVYGFEDQLSQIVAQLNTLGYEVLNSHYGSIKVNPHLSNLDNCLKAVDECDLFLGIIRPYCGTGNIGEKNITFEEIKEAIRLKKPYWFLVHRDVVYTRLLLKKVKLKSDDEVMFMDNRLFDKLSVEMYEYVIKNHIPVTLRNGNWAQEFYRLDEMMVYINAQFIDKDFIYEVMNPQQSNDGE
ncbi:MAG: DUF4062 domain-containing protein [Cytophagales bacterium]|nr:DUF4062 domain-containing protein [Cytophagales bacterium]MCA6373224.1 DUF4062 domain-containing protein [Cytophagales bacterium]MCA6377792.1 DUF4062 domain-containing protein [Cytophagales bacterium]MCA6386225.1 DUF4062 domain-containing protein [Cytophagales bacterium]